MVLGLRGFPNVQGGVERHAENLYPLLGKSGCEIEVIARSPYIPPGRTTWNGIRFRRLWSPRIPGVEALLHSLLGVVYAGYKRPDVLHIHAVGPAIVTPLARLFRLRVIVTHHGPDYDREKWGRFARAMLRLGEKWGMRYASGRIVISEVIKKLVLDKYGLDSIVIPNGVNLPVIPETSYALDKYSLVPGRYILLVGRIVPEKRLLDLINAFTQTGLAGWKLAIVGEFNSSDRYCKDVMSLANKVPGVVLTDFQSGIALQELYTHAGLFVLPSSHEGLPIALLEALSYGLTVLVSDIPAHLEVGLPEYQYFPLGDVAALSVAIRRLAYMSSNEDHRMELRTWVSQKYNWSCISARTLEVYQQVVN